MIPRYTKPEIAKIWSDGNKTELWQKTELAVIEARELLGKIAKGTFRRIAEPLAKNPISLEWWKKRETEIHHDLEAFVEERRRFLPLDLQFYFHGEGMTSFDTEEPAFAAMLRESVAVVMELADKFQSTLTQLARKYRYTLMMGRTHGQEAELITFGARCLTWLREMQVDLVTLHSAASNLRFSKLSGATGKYTGLDPDVEQKALKILGFEPFYGSTQIMPRALYTPLAGALCQLVLTLDKIALDLRLGARGPRAIYQEPFGRKQTGSSAMPHKRNPIRLEQMEGMARLAKAYFQAILENIKTWEERAIEQSCVERVAWPDFFHVTVHVLETMDKVLSGLRVYPDRMLLEVVESRGCYASSKAKEVIKVLGVSYGLSAEEGYRILQLAAFNVFEPSELARNLRENPPKSLSEADDSVLAVFVAGKVTPVFSIRDLVARGLLHVSPELEATEEQVDRWNTILRHIFSGAGSLEAWELVFQPSHLLRNLETLYKEILGD